jgi:hypothetical protein
LEDADRIGRPEAVNIRFEAGGLLVPARFDLDGYDTRGKIDKEVNLSPTRVPPIEQRDIKSRKLVCDVVLGKDAFKRVLSKKTGLSATARWQR